MESNCAVQLVHQILDMSLAKGIFPVQLVRLLRGFFARYNESDKKTLALVPYITRPSKAHCVP